VDCEVSQADRQGIFNLRREKAAVLQPPKGGASVTVTCCCYRFYMYLYIRVDGFNGRDNNLRLGDGEPAGAGCDCKGLAHQPPVS
jgi:hypothetical protein